MLSLLGLASCGPPAPVPGFDAEPSYTVEADEVWSAAYRGTGRSSPRLADVNGDDVLDIFLGAGVEREYGTMALFDGATGETIWRRDYADEVYATGCLLDVNGDEVPDVVVGRRMVGGDLDALDGRNGKPLWTLRTANPETRFPNLHFNSALSCPDLDGDGTPDLIVLQSGGKDGGRPRGRLYLLGSADGRLLKKIVMPDGNESYCVPSLDTRDGKGARLFLGTGGETLPGHVLCLDFPALTERWRFASQTKGFVGGGVLHDFDGTGRRDLVSASFDGTLSRLDGETGEPVWSLARPGFEIYSTPALGRFNEDDVLDVALTISEGSWPEYETRALILWVDGATGEVLEERRWGIFATGSPVVADLDGDGFDELVFTTNLSFSTNPAAMRSVLSIFDGRRGKTSLLSRQDRGFTAINPWLGDMDDDGNLDLVHAFFGQLVRLELSHPDEPTVHWNQYRGPAGDGVAPRRGAR